MDSGSDFACMRVPKCRFITVLVKDVRAQEDVPLSPYTSLILDAIVDHCFCWPSPISCTTILHVYPMTNLLAHALIDL